MREYEICVDGKTYMVYESYFYGHRTLRIHLWATELEVFLSIPHHEYDQMTTEELYSAIDKEYTEQVAEAWEALNAT